ncbi:MAG: glycosyl transferase family 2 [Saprospiraceae bacterium]|nr:MAG: glycosyl transferase family 2 [Saprospiraceae bacterium]
MLSVQNLYLQYGERILFDHISFAIGDRERIGLVGRNGAGKSTLLKIMAGLLNPDEGQIDRPANSTIGLLHQEMNLPKGKTVLEETMTAFAETRELEKKLEDVHHAIATRTDYQSPEYTKLLEELADLEHRFQLLGGHNTQAQAEKVLKGLGFRDADFQRLTDEFSGGWQMRIELAKMLLRQPDYLLLDEPTNHLDIESILWLESFLETYEGSIVVISHDKTFLDKVTRRTLEIELGKLYDYKASYSGYVELRRERREKLQAAWENQQRIIAEKERTIKRFMAKATKTSMAQSMQKQLDKMERIELDQEDTAVMNIRFPEPPRSGQVVVEARGLTKRYGDLLVLDGVDLKLDRGDRVAFVGQNGQGKTTLAKIIVGQLKPTAGELTIGHNVHIGYYAQNQAETLDPHRTLLETLEAHSPPEMRTRLRTLLGAFLFSGEDQEKKVMVLSGGERARLALACMLLKPVNLLVLDEPTNHLDILSKEVLKNALMQFTGTLIVVSHDRDFLSGLTDKTIEFRDHHLHTYLGDVNYFLEKRRLDHMREVEKRTQATRKVADEKTAATSSNGSPTLSYEERKQLQRQLQNARKQVEALEKRIAELERKMAEPDFYTRPGFEKTLAEHAGLKEALESALEAWMEAEERLAS